LRFNVTAGYKTPVKLVNTCLGNNI